MLLLDQINTAASSITTIAASLDSGGRGVSSFKENCFAASRQQFFECRDLVGHTDPSVENSMAAMEISTDGSLIVLSNDSSRSSDEE